MRKKRIKKESYANVLDRAKKLMPEKKESMGKCLILDGMNLAYASYYAYAKLRAKGKSVSIIFGMPLKVKALIQTEAADKVIICWDGDKHPRRMELLPTYKSHRAEQKDRKDEEKRKDFLSQIDRVQKLFYYMGIPQVYNEKMEGDDAVYWVTKRMQNLYNVTIVSGDKDFGQLINRNVSVLNPRNKYSDTWHTFLLDKAVEIHQFVDYLCLVGDDSDDIPGYTGIGPVRAAKFLKIHGSIRAYLKDKNSEFSGMNDKDKLKQIWKRNRELMDLKRFNEKHHSEKDVTYIKDKRMPSFNEKRFTRFCTKYRLKTFLFSTFKAPFLKLQENV